MKLRITFKTPDVLEEQTLKEDIALECPGPNVGPDRECPLCEAEFEKCKVLLDQFIKYGEMIAVEFDTETETAVVLKKD